MENHLEKGILLQDFANKYPSKVASLCCIGGYDINNFDTSLQKENSKEQMKMMFKAIFSIKAFANDNKKISAYTKEAQEKFYQMNIEFKKSSFKYLASLGSLVNKVKTQKRKYPLIIGVGEYDNNMAIRVSKMWAETEPNSKFVIFKNAGHIVNMDIPNEFNNILESFFKKQIPIY
ncbi:alpha/beta hydrolase [uncultured Clostridium sp.]|uniref:alpha/beta fold hydrolase n=1 Tax=uncultured Clostridium sp. TaxID=59620 RepID=UPI003217126B